MKKAVIASASSGIVAGLLLMGSASPVTADAADYSNVPTYTQSAITPGMHMMHRWNSPTKINALATSLGLDPVEVTAELKSGKNLKQILQENGIVPDQIGKAFSGRRAKFSNKNWK